MNLFYQLNISRGGMETAPYVFTEQIFNNIAVSGICIRAVSYTRLLRFLKRQG
jgi:hypothetical protein